MSDSPGCFVVLEGLDGAGTTTQTDRLAAALRGRGCAVHTTREPSGGPVGTLLRQALSRRLVLPDQQPLSPATLALLFAADRMDHLQAEIRPALARGEVVLCDRYVLSSLAYQGSAIEMEWVAAVNAQAVPPDLTLFLDVDVQTAARRRNARGGPAELFEEDEQQQKIRSAYRAAIEQRGQQDQVVVLDGAQSPEEVTAAALREILRLRGMD